MPTTRSLYTFEQFKQIFQQLAHVLAIEAVTALESGDLLIKAYHPWGQKYEQGALSEVNTGIYHFKFYAKHLSFSYDPDGSYTHPDHFSVDIEEKFYSTSAHSTKISFFSPEYKNEVIEVEDEYGFKEHPVDHKKTDAERNRRQKKIDKFLEKLMKDAGLKIEPRFSLEKYTNYTKPECTTPGCGKEH